jgi:ATP synthase I chain
MAPPPPTSISEGFFDQALPRIRKFLLALALAGIGACVLLFRWPVTAGFAVGATVSYVNQLWMERAVNALGARIIGGQGHERGGGIVLRALLRYVFIAAGGYVIFNVSLAALHGFLGGICLPIAAVACEVAVEIFVTLRRGF